jgi:hypothetical protein
LTIGFDPARPDPPIHGEPLLPESVENGFEEMGVTETADKVLPKGREMRDGLGEVVTDKPAVGHVGLDFPDGLTHGANAKEILDQHDF